MAKKIYRQVYKEVFYELPILQRRNAAGIYSVQGRRHMDAEKAASLSVFYLRERCGWSAEYCGRYIKHNRDCTSLSKLQKSDYILLK